MLKIILIVLVLAVAGLLAYAATRPDHFRVERSLTIQAPAERLFALVDDVTAWKQWSPYVAKDPAAQYSYSGPTAGVGATSAWSGNNQIGEGRMQISESQPPSRIVMQLDFVKPMKAHHVATFDFVASGDGTTVTWAMEGQSSFIAKLMSVFFDMDQMIGGDFAQGLQNLRQLTESH